MSASSYPVTFPYGATSPPYGTPSMPYHRGDDRAMPVGTPVVVNNVQIGLSGNTGMSTGAHLHIGRFVGGGDTNPNGNGFSLTDPVTVTTVASDATNGNYVRLTDGNGVQWVYLHLSSQSVSQGQVLKGGNMPGTADSYTVQALAEGGLGRTAQGDPNLQNNIGRPVNDVIDTFRSYPEWKNRQTKANTATSDQVVDETAVRQAYNAGLLRDPTQEEINNRVNNRNTLKQMQSSILDSEEHKAILAKVNGTPPNATVLKPGTYKVV